MEIREAGATGRKEHSALGSLGGKAVLPSMEWGIISAQGLRWEVRTWALSLPRSSRESKFIFRLSLVSPSLLSDC